MLTIFGTHERKTRGPFPLVRFLFLPMGVAAMCAWFVRLGTPVATAVFAGLLTIGILYTLSLRGWLVGAGVNPWMTSRTFPWRYFFKANAVALVVLALCATAGFSVRTLGLAALVVIGGGNLMQVLDWLRYSSRGQRPGGGSGA
jgi:hypothetical protein